MQLIGYADDINIMRRKKELFLKYTKSLKREPKK